MLGNFWSKAALFKEFRHRIRNFIQIFPFHFTPLFAFFDMAYRHRNHDTVSNQVAEVQLTFDFGFGRELSIILIIVVNKFKDISIEFFFGANQRLYSSLKGKRKEGILPRHVFVEFLDSLGLRSQEVVMFQQFNNLYQKV